MMTSRLLLVGLIVLTANACSLARQESCEKPRYFERFNFAPRGVDAKTRNPGVLSPDVQAAVNRYVAQNATRTSRPLPANEPTYGTSHRILAARDEGRYVLLEIENPTAFDANWFVVYSKNLDCIVGTFVWRTQG
jgi:hypothetical protein